MADQRTMAELLRAPTEGYAEAIVAWDRYKDLLRPCPHHGFTELNQLDTFYNALNPADQDSLNDAAGGNLLERRSQDVLTIIEKNLSHQYSIGPFLDGPTIPTPPPFINPEEDERVEETLIDLDLAEYTIKVLPPPVQKYKPPSQREYVVHQRDPLHPNILYPSRMLKQKQQKKDEVQIHKIWQMFKQLHINITLVDALILMPKHQKMLKALLSNKEKLQELANTPLNENCLACKALTNLGASINLMPLSVWKKLAGIARDVFVPVGKFTFPADFVIIDYESDLRVRLILERPFLRSTRALINVHGEEMILCDGDEILTLNMRHDTSSYSNQPQKESINLINVFNNSSEDFLEDLFSTDQPSGNPTFLSHPELTLPKVQNDIFHLEGGNMFTDEHALDYSSPPIFDEYDDDFLEVESDIKNIYDDPFNFIGEKIKEVDALPSTNNEDKVFNTGIHSQENPFEIITRVVQDKKLAISNASLMLEDFDPPIYEPLFFKEVSSIPRNLKTNTEGFCPPVLISSASIRKPKSFRNQRSMSPDTSLCRVSKPGHLAARLGCVETKVVTWGDLAFKLITLG
nr:hypothetical protein [Tanacetum cinerariifolium]